MKCVGMISYTRLFRFLWCFKINWNNQWRKCSLPLVHILVVMYTWICQSFSSTTSNVKASQKLTVSNVCTHKSEILNIVVTVFFYDRCHLSGLLATACGDDSIRIFKEDPSSSDPNQPSFELYESIASAHSEDVNSVCWNPKVEGLLASCSDDGKVNLWMVENTWQCSMALWSTCICEYRVHVLFEINPHTSCCVFVKGVVPLTWCYAGKFSIH